MCKTSKVQSSVVCPNLASWKLRRGTNYKCFSSFFLPTSFSGLVCVYALCTSVSMSLVYIYTVYTPTVHIYVSKIWALTHWGSIHLYRICTHSVWCLPPGHCHLVIKYLPVKMAVVLLSRKDHSWAFSRVNTWSPHLSTWEQAQKCWLKPACILTNISNSFHPRLSECVIILFLTYSEWWVHYPRATGECEYKILFVKSAFIFTCTLQRTEGSRT